VRKGPRFVRRFDPPRVVDDSVVQLAPCITASVPTIAAAIHAQGFALHDCTAASVNRKDQHPSVF